MTEKLRKDPQSSVLVTEKPPSFRIPKKKPEDWCEDVQVNSPLTRLTDLSFKNVTTRKRHCSSYNSFNERRNKDSCAYYMSGYGPYNSSSPKDWKEPKLILTNVLESDLGRQYMEAADKVNVDVAGSPRLSPSQHHVFNRQPKIVLMDILRTGFGRQSANVPINHSDCCNEADFRVYSSSSPSSNNEESCLIVDDSQGDTSVSPRPENRTQLFSNTESPCKKPPDNIYPENRLSVEGEEQRVEILQEVSPSKVCQDVSNRPISSPKDVDTWVRKKRAVEAKSHSFQDLSKAENEDQLKGNLLPLSRKIIQATNYCQKQTGELINKVPSPTFAPPEKTADKVQSFLVGNNTKRPTKMSSPSSASNDPKYPEKTSENESSLVTPERMESDRQCKRRLRLKTHLDDSSSSSNPIVLSSDEEATTKTDAFAAEIPSTAETILTQTSTDDSKEFSKNEVESCSKAEHSLLEIKFNYVHFGKKKARSTGCVKFSPKSIAIPLKMPLQKGMCLTMDTRKLLRYGLWENKGELGRRGAVIFLWLDKDYVQFLNKQIGANTSIETSRTEFIFLELNDSLTKNEEAQLKETMKQASKNGSSTLAENISWDEAYPLLNKLAPNHISFILNSTFSCHFLQDQGHLRTRTLAEDLKEKPAPSYSLLQRCENGHHSASLAPRKDNCWSPMQNGGLLQKLIVYPPPPTKGGLGVTNEDLGCLEHGEFLNDVIIDFYLKYLLLEKFPKAFAERCHIFSSFFFKCLMRKDQGSDDNSNSMSAERRHQRVKTWTRHVDLFSKDFVFVPVNENSHWYLVVICFPGLENAVYEAVKKSSSKIIRSPETKISSNCETGFVSTANDPMECEGGIHIEGSSCNSPRKSVIKEKSKQPETNPLHKISKRPCFLIFDSLTTPSVHSTINILREYLRVEWDMKKKSAREFTSSTFKTFHPKVPKQDNSTDCGLYLLQYVESFSLKPIDNFDHPMHLQNWFPQSLVKSKREEIRDLILQLHLKQRCRS